MLITAKCFNGPSIPRLLKKSALFRPCLTFFTDPCYHTELLGPSPHACLFRDGSHATNFWQVPQTKAGRDHEDEASQAKQPWHWQSERAAIVQRNTPPLMKTPAPRCQQLNLPPPKSPGGGITREWCTTGGSHGGQRRWQEWLRESEWGFFFILLLFQGWKQEGGMRLTRKLLQQTSGQSHRFLFQISPPPPHPPPKKNSK